MTVNVINILCNNNGHEWSFAGRIFILLSQYLMNEMGKNAAFIFDPETYKWNGEKRRDGKNKQEWCSTYNVSVTRCAFALFSCHFIVVSIELHRKQVIHRQGKRTLMQRNQFECLLFLSLIWHLHLSDYFSSLASFKRDFFIFTAFYFQQVSFFFLLPTSVEEILILFAGLCYVNISHFREMNEWGVADLFKLNPFNLIHIHGSFSLLSMHSLLICLQQLCESDFFCMGTLKKKKRWRNQRHWLCACTNRRC